MSIAHQNAHTIIRDILSKQHIERGMVCWLRWFINRFLAGEIFFSV